MQQQNFRDRHLEKIVPLQFNDMLKSLITLSLGYFIITKAEGPCLSASPSCEDQASVVQDRTSSIRAAAQIGFLCRTGGFLFPGRLDLLRSDQWLFFTGVAHPVAGRHVPADYAVMVRHESSLSGFYGERLTGGFDTLTTMS